MDNFYKKFAQVLLREEFKDCVMAEIPVDDGDVDDKDSQPIRQQILSFIESIPNEILYTDGEDHGKEEWPHITMLYGLEDGQSDEVKELLKGMDGKIKATLGKVTKFENKEFDVLKISVESEDLTKINKLLKTLPNENSYPTYVPHVTLAYVKTGEGDEFVGSDIFDGIVISIEKIIYSDKDRNHKKILGEMVGWAGTFNGTSQHLDKFGKSSKHTSRDIANTDLGSERRSSPQMGNVILGWSQYDSIQPQDLQVQGVDPDELYLGIKTEMTRQLKPNKNQAKQTALDNIGLDPKHYSGLKMYMSENKITHEQKISAISDIIRDLQGKRNSCSSAVNNPANQMIQSAIKERSSGRSIESISEIMRDMYNAEKLKPKKTLKDIQ